VPLLISDKKTRLDPHVVKYYRHSSMVLHTDNHIFHCRNYLEAIGNHVEDSQQILKDLGVAK